ncbi:MAG: NAD(P)/FAD-dependent oxidoreductase [Haloferacaceae archaeon]
MDIVVVGGGIAGSACGHRLARAGADVRLFDRGDEGRATDAGAGIVSPPTSSRSADDAWLRLAVEAADRYPDLVAELGDAVGRAGYAPHPLLRVALPGEESSFDRALADLRERGDRLGVPDLDAVTTLDPADARARFPPLGEVTRALLYEGAARVDGRRFAAACREAGEAAGLVVERGDVERLRVADGAVTGVVVDGEPVDADAVVVAGGAWSGAFADDLGVPVPVEPMRGQIVHLDAGRGGDDPATGDWPILTTTGHGYVVPWPEGHVVAGATYEEGSGFVPYPDVAGVRTVLDRTERAAPGLASAAFEEVRVGLRPATPDGRPVVGGVPGVEGAYVATGFGPTGLTIGPYAGEVVADLALGRDPGVDLGAFAVGRFR